MTNELAFNYHEAEVMVVRDDQGEPWWVAKDVAEILNITTARTIMDRLDEDECGKTSLTDSSGREQQT